MYGRRRAQSRGPPTKRPGTCPANPGEAPQRVIVLGAGLGRHTVAAALARRGTQVPLLERDTIASGGSGNEQGVLYTRLSPQHSPLTDFALQSFRFSSAFYRDMFAAAALRAGTDGALCGSFQQSADASEMDVLPPRPGRRCPELASVLDPVTASEKTGRGTALCRLLVSTLRLAASPGGLPRTCGPPADRAA